MESDSTQVTGSPISARGPRRGTVLGERYEILDAIDGDALGLTYKALDQESESHVLFRLPAPGALGEKDARAFVQRLSPLVGIGGRTIARVRDVDREGSLVFIVEPWPAGTTVRAILEARRNKNSIFSTQELLPVVVALAEATMAIPAPWFHGDLRPHRIYVSAEGVRVTGGFALAVLPGDVIVDALHDDVGLRRQFAPEVGDGLAGKPADRWAVAALAWEALTGRPPEPGPKNAPEAVTELGKVLLRYLDPDPTLRPPTLDLLVSTIAKHASLPAPKLVPEPFRIETEPVNDERTQQIDPRDLKPADAGKPSMPSSSRPPPAINDTAKMQALVLTRDFPEGGATVKDSSERDLSDIDPGLLRAAAINRKLSDSGTFKLDAQELEQVAGKKGGAQGSLDSGELDPRLVRAALSVDEGTDPGAQLDAPAHGRAARKPSASATEELDAIDLGSAAIAKPTTATASASKAGGQKAVAPKPMPAPMPKPKPKPATVVSAPKPMPAPMPAPKPAAVASASKPMPAPKPAVVSAPAPRPAPMAAPTPQPTPTAAPAPRAPIATAPPALVPAPRPFVPQAETRIDRALPPEPRSNGTLIIALAIGFAVTILALAFWYRSSQQESARQRHIDEQVRQIQSQ